MLFTIPLIPELLIKSSVKTAKLSVNLGTWSGLKIICVGPKGGKIVGYSHGHKPIYAGSAKAKSLALLKQQQKTYAAKPEDEGLQEKSQGILDWLSHLDIKAAADGDFVGMTASAGEMLASHFGVTPVSKKPTIWAFKVQALLPSMGKLFHPKEDEHAAWAANIASGDDENKDIPDFSELKEEKNAGKYAGSHGNRLFLDKTGKWLNHGIIHYPIRGCYSNVALKNRACHIFSVGNW